MIKQIKRRYIAFQIMPHRIFAKKDLQNLLINEIATGTNEPLRRRPYIRVIEFDRESGYGILRCGHVSLNQLLQSLHESGKLKQLKLRTLGTSGSIKTLKRKFLSKEFK